MKSTFVLFILVCLAFSTHGQQPKRPQIRGISQVRILVSNEKQANDFYYGILRTVSPTGTESSPCDWCERAPIGDGVWPIEFDPIHGKPPHNLLKSITFRTDDAKGLHELLKKNRIKVSSLKIWNGGSGFSATDPEQHRLAFVEGNANSPSESGLSGAYASGGRRWAPMLHAGLIVKDRAAMDKFYRDILGFHLYWSGGMKDGETNWVSMQVPDGTDWIEYMLNVDPNADQHLRGVMNHIALGVPSVKEAAIQLEKNGVKLTEQPKIGRDGKWQLNLYDPDQTRVELMEFTPVEKPCCSEFTGIHPKP